MSGNGKIAWDQPHETSEMKEQEGEIEVREEKEEDVKDGFTDSYLCASLSCLSTPSKMIFHQAESA